MRRGIALVVVLGVVTALALLSAATALSQRTGLRLADRFADRSAATAAAEAGLERAVALARADLTARVDPAWWTVDLGDASARLVVPGRDAPVPGWRSEDAYVNLNTASPALIAALPGSDAAAADLLVAERRRRNQAQGRVDPVDQPEAPTLPPPAGLVDRPFPDAASLRAAVPALAPLLAQPRFRAVVTFRSSGRIALAQADAAVLTALGVSPTVAPQVATRRWSSRQELLAFTGLEDRGWNRRHLALGSAAWRVLSVGRQGDQQVVAEAFVVRETTRLRLTEAHRRDLLPDATLGWVLP